MDELLNDLLECSVCLDRLDFSSKVLPCQHTFCTKCLQDIADSHKELRCPECRVLVETKIDDLPPNVLLTRILEGMKNAANNQQSQRGGGAPSTPSSIVTSKTSNAQHPATKPSSATTTAATPQSIQQQLKDFRKIPHAKAIYDFSSKEGGDLNFKKGDLIVLKKRIDHNWYIGELNGKTGSFPVNHVHIVLPLPVPQCKALYDFKMKPGEEEGCLAFKKGAIINVLRRVDHNWAEGRIEDAIGIFPISFVEMNALAKQLMDISAKNMQMSSSSSRTVPIPPFETNFTDSSSTPTTVSPNSTPSNTSSSDSTAPNSPQNANPAPVVVRTRPSKEKRHSLTTTNRHSAEILTVPGLDPAAATPRSAGATATASTSKPNGARGHSRSKSTSHDLPAAYVALYPYKPQKPDELELKKGAIYYVMVKCQDGWFKGINRAQKAGVFPGNYVAPVKNRELAPNLSRSTGPGVGGSGRPEPVLISQLHFQQAMQGHPPDLPPRDVEPQQSSSSSSMWNKAYMYSLLNKKSSATNASKNTAVVTAAAAAGELPGSSATTVKEKKDSGGAVNFVKRFTNIKRSKSPNAPSPYSMDNPVFEDAIASPSTPKQNINLSHPVHVRSGSCPSQLLQNLPPDGTSLVYGSQRIKGHKERPSMQHLRNNADLTLSAVNNRLRNAAAAAAATSSSEPSNRGGSVTVAVGSSATPSQPPERFRCIVPYPPNSEYELELNVNDIVFVLKKRENGWYKGQHQRTGKIGLFPASFVTPDL